MTTERTLASFEVIADEGERLRRAWLTLSVVSMASVLTALGGSALNVALPQVVRQTHGSADAAAGKHEGALRMTMRLHLFQDGERPSG